MQQNEDRKDAELVDAAASRYRDLMDQGLAPAIGEYVSPFPPHLAKQVERRCRSYDIYASSLRPEKRPPSGDHQLAGFELREIIGEGAMGVVYVAQQSGLEREVAVKVLREELRILPESLRRFRDEAKILARLSHPSIVRVISANLDASPPAIVMELVDGYPLASLLDDTRLENSSIDPSRCAELVADIAEGLQIAHDNKIVHRDLKPQNILLTRDGQPKIVDFGLSKILDRSDWTTRDGSRLGTTWYMSPEQAAEDCNELDHRSDVFSLGTILYELLTTERPFDGASELAVLARIRAVDATPPRKLNPRIPQDLETICLKALQKSPQDRYASAREFARDLRSFLAHESITARAPGWFARLRQGARRHRTALAAAVVIVATSLTTWAGLSYQAELKSRRENLALVESVVAIDDFSNVSARRLSVARAAAGKLRRSGHETKTVEVLGQRLEKLRRDLLEEVESVKSSMVIGEDVADDALVNALFALQRISTVYDDNEILNLLDRRALAPRLSVSITDTAGRPLSGTVSHRSIDTITGQLGEAVSLGPLPVKQTRVFSGLHRITVELPGIGRREFTRHIVPGMPDLEYIVRDAHVEGHEFQYIAGGALNLNDDDASMNPLNGRRVEVQPFEIDRYEVSNRQYRRFLAAHPLMPVPAHLRDERCAPGSPADELPVVGVSWGEARAYAEWIGARLPTHAEWVLAARGSEGRRFPWGNDGYRGNVFQERAPVRNEEEALDRYLKCAAAVRSSPDASTPMGLHNMFGNVWEWTESPQPDKVETIRNSLSVFVFTSRIHRRVVLGAAWDAKEDGETLSRALSSLGDSTSYRVHDVGFRCARSITN